jgi:hypothetical protein
MCRGPKSLGWRAVTNRRDPRTEQPTIEGLLPSLSARSIEHSIPLGVGLDLPEGVRNGCAVLGFSSASWRRRLLVEQANTRRRGRPFLPEARHTDMWVAGWPSSGVSALPENEEKRFGRLTLARSQQSYCLSCAVESWYLPYSNVSSSMHAIDPLSS